MFEVTFTGHQGWVLRSARACILADTVLGEEFGHGPTSAVMWPPREIDDARFPPIDAVFVSHEHSDHFSPSTLARLDRRTPILLPARSSLAAHALLEEMGFQTLRLTPGDVVTVGDLELHVHSPDHVASENADEWDVLPFAVRDAAGDGSFACFVDVATPPAAEKKMIEALGGRVGVYALTNNSCLTRIAFAGGVSSPDYDTVRMLGAYAEWYARFVHEHSAPEAVLLCGGGFSFTERLAWMNRNFFNADNELIAAGLSAALPGRVLRAATPGDTLRMEKGKLTATTQASFLRAAPRAEWPERRFVGDIARVERVEPLLPRPVAEADLPELEAVLDGLAGHMYGSANFRAIYSLEAATLAGRKPTFAFVLRVEDGAYVFEWQPQGCQFVATESKEPAAEFACGAELWACDLLAVARGEVEWITIQLAHFRAWNMAPGVLKINTLLFMSYFAALRRPDIFLKLYRTALARHPQRAPTLRAGGAPVALRGG